MTFDVISELGSKDVLGPLARRLPLAVAVAISSQVTQTHPMQASVLLLPIVALVGASSVQHTS